MDGFRRCLARVDRAKAHRNAATEEWNSFLENEPFDTTCNVYNDGSGDLVVVQTQPTPDAISFLLGEWLYQLRAALDNCVYEVAAFDSGRRPPPRASSLGFPIHESESRFRRANAQIQPLNARHQTWIEAAQPFRGTPRLTALYWLNRLAREDRHRHVQVVGSYIPAPDPLFRIDDTSTIEIERTGSVMIRGEAIVARFTVSPYSAGQRVEANPNLHIQPEIPVMVEASTQPGTWLQTPLHRRLWMIETVVLQLISAFEEDCVDAGKR